VYKIQVTLAAFVVAVVSGLYAINVSADHKSHTEINKRIAPAGKVYRVGDDVPVAVAPVAATTGTRDGEAVYTASCAMCHASGVAGAPKAGDAAAWTDRVAQGEAVLFEHAIKGYQGSAGFMPAKGGCAACSDEEVEAAVNYMLDMLK
jgi:cytochrome c5